MHRRRILVPSGGHFRNSCGVQHGRVRARGHELHDRDVRGRVHVRRGQVLPRREPERGRRPVRRRVVLPRRQQRPRRVPRGRVRRDDRPRGCGVHGALRVRARRLLPRG